MKVIKRSQMPDGTEIQMEDWKENYSFLKTLTIGAYPKAKNTSKGGWVKSDKTFRLSLEMFENDEEVENIFKQLETGKISLEELSEHFRNGHKDKFYLGLVDNEEPNKINPDLSSRYALLDRLISDCKYYLGNGYRYEKHLWAKNVDEQIAKMKELYNSFKEDEKPEWTSLKEIEDFEKKMKNKIKTMEDWKESEFNNFEDFFKPGDTVGKDVVEYFINSVPPVTLNGEVVQPGEAYCHRINPETLKEQAKYITFTKEFSEKDWIYVGNRFKGETIEDIKRQENIITVSKDKNGAYDYFAMKLDSEKDCYRQISDGMWIGALVEQYPETKAFYEKNKDFLKETFIRLSDKQKEELEDEEEEESEN